MEQVRTGLICALGALLLTACVSSQVTSYTDPAYRASPKFSSVLVAAFGMGLQEAETVESAAVQAFGANGVRSLRSLDVIPPTRQMTQEEIITAVLATEAASVLMIVATEKGASTAYVAPKRRPATITGTIEPFGNMWLLRMQQTGGGYSPGYTVSMPNARYVAVLGDLGKGGIVWQAEAAARDAGITALNPYLAALATPDYDALARAMAGDVVAKLVADGLF